MKLVGSHMGVSTYYGGSIQVDTYYLWTSTVSLLVITLTWYLIIIILYVFCVTLLLLYQPWQSILPQSSKWAKLPWTRQIPKQCCSSINTIRCSCVHSVLSLGTILPHFDIPRNISQTSRATWRPKSRIEAQINDHLGASMIILAQDSPEHEMIRWTF